MHCQQQPLEQQVQRIVERPLSVQEISAMRAEMEKEMQQQAVQQGDPLGAETLHRVCTFYGLPFGLLFNMAGLI